MQRRRPSKETLAPRPGDRAEELGRVTRTLRPIRRSCSWSSDGGSSRSRTAARIARHRGLTTSPASSVAEDEVASFTSRSSSSTRSRNRADATAERRCSSAVPRSSVRTPSVAVAPSRSCSGSASVAAATRAASTSMSRTVPRHSPIHPNSARIDGTGSIWPFKTRMFERRRRTDVRAWWTAAGSGASARCRERSASTEGANDRSVASGSGSGGVWRPLIGVRPAGDPSAGSEPITPPNRTSRPGQACFRTTASTMLATFSSPSSASSRVSETSFHRRTSMAR